MKKTVGVLLLVLISSFSCKKETGTCWMCINSDNKAIWEKCDVTEDQMKEFTGPGKPCIYYLKN